jgi:hypothetical protein
VTLRVSLGSVRPEGIIEDTRPRAVILAHWEDHFLTQDAYCEGGGHYGPATTGTCRKGRIFGIASPNWLHDDIEGTDTKRFVARATRALAKVDRKAPAPQVPCPTRSVFEFAPGKQADE